MFNQGSNSNAGMFHGIQMREPTPEEIGSDKPPYQPPPPTQNVTPDMCWEERKHFLFKEIGRLVRIKPPLTFDEAYNQLLDWNDRNLPKFNIWYLKEKLGFGFDKFDRD
jgi:hypothetical protein